MFLAQLAVCAALWALVVVRLVRRRDALTRRAAAQTPGRRVRTALAKIVASVLVLGSTMALLTRGGLTERGLSWWGWPLVTVAGAVFVVLQTGAMVPLVLKRRPTRKRARGMDRPIP